MITSASAKAGAFNPFADIQKPIAEARHLPGSIYTSQEQWEKEKAGIFLKEWLMVCRVEELPEAGDYIATRIMGEAVLIARGRDGRLNAMANVCRHRGVEVATGRGNSPLFVCPYHAWTYELDGKLRGAPFMGTGRKTPENCNLRKFHVVEWRGCVFINMAENPTSFESFIKPFDDKFSFLRFEDCRLVRKVEFIMDCNWKLSIENLVDIYHVGTVHAKTFGGRYKTDKEGFAFDLLPNGSVALFEDAAPLTKEGKSLTGQIPWLADRAESFAALGLLWPNHRISARSDYLRIWNIWPLAVNKTHMICYMLFPEAVLEQADLDQKVDVYAEFLKTAIEEDRAMVESLQLGVGSTNFDPGPLANLEAAIHHFLNHYSARMSGSQ